MKSRYSWLLLLAPLAGCSLLLAGCGVAPTLTASPLATPSRVDTPTVDVDGSGQVQETRTPGQPEGSAAAKPTLVEEEAIDDSANLLTAGLIEQAREDLKSRLQIEAGRINLESVEAVQWRDSSLGCPQPGRSYLMVITPGHLIVLEADGQVYEYHASENHVVYCDDSVPPFDQDAQPETLLIELAKADLAERLNIATGQIKVGTVESKQWPDASLGCPQPGMMYAQVVTPGFQIVLSAEGREFDYRTDFQRAILCEP